VRARDEVRKDSSQHATPGQVPHPPRSRVHGGKNWTQRFWVWLRTQQLDRNCERLTFEHYVHEVEHHVERR
jgi:hypothetical protein